MNSKADNRDQIQGPPPNDGTANQFCQICEPAKSNPGRDNAQPPGQTVSSIVPCQLDCTGLRVKTVYSKVSEIYAVYSNTERLMVQFADDVELGKQQRLALAHLAPLRGEINGLIDGWRSATNKHLASKTKRYDRRTADAIVIALQGAQEDSLDLLRSVKMDIFEERLSIGRSLYMICAIVCSILIVVFFGALNGLEQTLKAYNIITSISEFDLLLVTGFGCLGALFSIALAIRSRDINTDIRWRDNVVDAALRILVGATSAVLLVSLLKSNLFSLSLNGFPVKFPNKTADDPTGVAVHVASVVAFLAGFSERLLGNFLTTSVLGATGAKPDRPPPQSAAETQQRRASDETDPLGKKKSTVS